MKQTIVLITLAVLASQLQAAPQFITFKDGKLGVNFGGYHAGVGFGGGQGLFAEAGTPHGQHAAAGLGGAMGGNGNTGGLFAGATAGNGIKAQAGLGGTTNGQNSAGAGFAQAQYGNRIAAAGLGGQASDSESTGYKFAGTNAAPPTVIIKEKVPVETVVAAKPSSENEIDGFENVLPLNAGNANVNFQARTNIDVPVVEKEVSRPWGYQQEFRNYNSPFTIQTVMKSVFRDPGFQHPPLSQPRIQVHRLYQVAPVETIVEKSKVYYKHRPSHHVHKVAYVGTTAERRSDTDFAGSENVGAHVQGGGQVTVNKEIHLQRNPQFFSDIFNIPITALNAVGKLLGSAIDNTKVSVQKTATVSQDSDITSRHAYEPASASSSVSAGHQVTVETQQPASDFFQNIFAIPINTLGAVNTFLEKNVPARKRIQVTQSGDHEIDASASVHLGPHARRRAAKRVILVDTSKATGEH